MVSVCLPSDALLQHLPSYLDFSYLGCGVSHHGCSSKPQLLLLTLDEGYLFMASPPDLEHEVAPLGWNAKVGSQETPGVTGKLGLGVWNEAGQRLIEFCQENAQVIANTHSNHTREDSTCGHHQMVNTEIRLIIFFAAKDGEALYNQHKQDQELTVAQS